MAGKHCPNISTPKLKSLKADIESALGIPKGALLPQEYVVMLTDAAIKLGISPDKVDFNNSNLESVRSFIYDKHFITKIPDKIVDKEEAALLNAFIEKYKNQLNKVFSIDENFTKEDYEELLEILPQITNDFFKFDLLDDKIFISFPIENVKENLISSITFTTSEGGYPQRRKENIALSDITIALAEDFTTAGEKGTKTDAKSKYVSSPIKESGKKLKAKQIAESLVKDIKKAKLPTNNVKLNIAGNGIYSLSESQEYYNNLVTDIIKELQNLGITVAEIRSGGQTGIDEAAIIAAQRLGIPAIVHGTKDWAFRGKDNKDIKGNETAYKARFNVTTQPTPDSKGKMTFSYGKNRKTLSDYVEEVNKMIEFFNSKVVRSENFEKDHKYFIVDEDGNKKEVKFSATTLNNALQNADKALKSYKDVTSSKVDKNNKHIPIGNAFDALVRDFFNNRKIVQAKAYDNISASIKTSLLKQLNLFEKALDKQFGKGKYQVITKEFALGGYITDATGKSYGIAGTMDMLVVTEDGSLYIYDMKTTSKDSIESDSVKYNGQLGFYKNLISANFPEIGNRIKGLGLIVGKVTFPTDGKVGYKVIDGVVYFDGDKLAHKKYEKSYNITISTSNNAVSGYIKSLSLETAIDEEKISALPKEVIKELLPGEIKAMKDVEKRLFSTKGKVLGDSENNATISSPIDTEALQEGAANVQSAIKPVSAEEVTFLGRNLIRLAAYQANQLSVNDEYRKTLFGNMFPENFFVGKSVKEIFTMPIGESSTGLVLLLKTNRNTYFGNYSNPRQKWVYDNYNYILFESNYELLGLEGISIVNYESLELTDTPEYQEGEYNVEETDKDGREHYAIDQRTVGYLSSMNNTVKRFLSTIPVMTADNKHIGDKYGFKLPQFYDKAYTTNTLYGLLHSCETSEEMLEVLGETIANESIEEDSKRNWLEDVRTKLINDSDFKTLFFKEFRKNMNYYMNVYLVSESSGKKEIQRADASPLGIESRAQALTNELVSRLNSKDNSLLPDIAEDKEESDPSGLFKVNEEIWSEIIEDKNALKSIKDTRKIIKRLEYILKDIGYDQNLSLSMLNNKAYSKTIGILKANIEALINKIGEAKKGGKAVSVALISKEIHNISRTIAPVMPAYFEISAYDNNKNYMVYSKASYLQTLIDKLSGVNPKYKDISSIQEMFGNHRQFRTVRDGKVVYISSWLNDIIEDESLRELLQHTVTTSINKKDHNKQTDAEYLLGLLVMYNAPNTTNFFTKESGLHIYSTPTMSDKPANEGIIFKGYGSINPADYEESARELKETITEKVYEFFNYELDRMRAVVEQLVSNKKSLDVEDFHLNRNEPEIIALRNRLLLGGSITIEDFSKNSPLYKHFMSSGLSFRYCSVLNEHLSKKGKFSKFVLDKINGKKVNPSKIMETFTELFIEGVDKEFDQFKQYAKSTLETLPVDQGVSSKETVVNSLGNTVLDFGASLDAFLEEFFWNDMLANMNIINLTIIDPAYYKNTENLQKRYAQLHASTTKPDINANIRITDQGLLTLDSSGTPIKISNGKHRVLVINDVEIKPEDLVKKMNESFAHVEMLARNAGDLKTAEEFKNIRKVIPDVMLKNGVNVTDGQSYTTPTGMMKKLAMLGELTPEWIKAYNKIRQGNFNIADINTITQPIKPFVYTHLKKEGVTNLGEEVLPYQIKNSEALLFLYSMIPSDSNDILSFLYDYVENSHFGGKKNATLKDYVVDGIDTIAFKSAVKAANFGVVDLNSITSETLKSKIEEAKKDKLEEIKENPEAYIKEFDFIDWGKQQENPGHLKDHEQAMGSQPRIIIPSGIPDSVTATNNPIEVTYKNESGKLVTEKLGKKEATREYFNLIAEDFQEGYNEIKELFDVEGVEFNEVISNMVIESMKKDSRYPLEAFRAFILDNEQQFKQAIADPTIADKVYGSILSLIKKKVNNEDTMGGPVVQMSAFGLSDNLHIGYDDPVNKTGLYFEAYVTPPTEEIARKITDKNGKMYSMETILKKKLLTERELEMIAYRIPTESKYSIFRCRIKGFLPRQQGEVVVLPKEITGISGADFDIDKLYCMFRYNTKGFEKKAKAGELSEKDKKKYNKYSRKNKIFDYQWGMLGHSSSSARTLAAQDISILKDLAKQINPDFDSVGNISFAHNRVKMRALNAAGKEFVGIAALNNVSHRFGTFAKLKFNVSANPIIFNINGVNSLGTLINNGLIEIDPEYSPIDNYPTAKLFEMLVGVAADNAKDPLLGKLNINPNNATLALGLVRMGIPMKTMIYMMNHPLIKQYTQDSVSEGLEELVGRLSKETKLSDFNSVLASTNITDEYLLEVIQGKTDAVPQTDLAIAYLLKTLLPLAEEISDLNTIYSLNSTKNSVGPDIFTTINKMYKINDLEYKYEVGLSPIVTEDGSSPIDYIKENIPLLKPLIECYTDLVPSICKKFSPLFSSEFATIVSKLQATTRYNTRDEKKLKALYNQYLMYNASKEYIDMSEESRKNSLYGIPVSVIELQGSMKEDITLIRSLGTGIINNKYRIQGVGFNNNTSRDIKDDVSSSWESLYLKHPETAEALFKYGLMRWGFNWTPNSTVNVSPNILKRNESYKSIFKVNNDLMTMHADNFIRMFIRNNLKGYLLYNFNVENSESLDITKDESTIVLDVNELSEYFGNTGILGFRYKKIPYLYSGVAKDGRLIYKRTYLLGIPKQFLEYNANEDASEMKTVVTAVNNAKQKDMIDSLNFEMDAPMSEDSYSEEETVPEVPTKKEDKKASKESEIIMNIKDTADILAMSIDKSSDPIKKKLQAIEDMSELNKILKSIQSIVTDIESSKQKKSNYSSVLEQLKEILC